MDCSYWMTFDTWQQLSRDTFECEDRTGCGAEIRPSLVCWFWHYVHHFAYLLNFPAYILFFCSYFPLLIYFLTYIFLWEYASSISRPEVIRDDQTWVYVFILYCSIFMFLVNGCLCCIRFCYWSCLGYIFCGCFSWVWFCFLSTIGLHFGMHVIKWILIHWLTFQEIGWEECLHNDILRVEWNVKP